MTDAATPAPTPTPRKLRWLLALSVGLNLAVAGFVIGDALDGGLRGQRFMPRDMAFGPFTEALEPAERRALARALFERAPDLRQMRGHMQGDLDQIIAALQADPFAPAALDEALAGHSRRVGAALGQAEGVLRDFLVAMAPGERIAFAARLQGHGRGHD